MTATFYVGDAIEVMSKLPEKSVDLVLTSPPFLALRSYLPADHPDKALEGGSQATPGAFIDWLVDVVEACDRVLAPHGSLCIELGDTYAGSGGAGGDYGDKGWREGQLTYKQQQQVAPKTQRGPRIQDRRHNAVTGNKNRDKRPGWALDKSLSLIPELFRLTLVYGFNPLTGRQTERWRLRNVVRWVRPNPPVGALGDKFRPATSELMVFCKSAKRYFDLDAVREPHKEPWRSQPGIPEGTGLGRPEVGADRYSERVYNPAGAPPLDWWNIPPGGYEGAHYAVFPPELCIKPIKAMSPEKVCQVCGEPSRRIVETSYERLSDGSPLTEMDGWRTGRGGIERGLSDGKTPARSIVETLGFSDCGHGDYRPGLVLDPFGGSGTTALVATGHGRDCILIDLDERNFDLALQRVGPFILERAG